MLIHFFLISVKLKQISFLTEVKYILIHLFTFFSFRFNQLERKGRQQGKGMTVGKVSMESICGYIGYARSPFTDGLLDLIDIHHNGNLDFGQFTLLICTYCMFEKIDILKCNVLYIYFPLGKIHNFNFNPTLCSLSFLLFLTLFLF